MLAGRVVALCALAACHSYGSGDDPVDASSSQSAVRVRCTTDLCPDDRPICCSTPPDAGGVRGFECRAEGACADGVVVPCRDSADCPTGTACCLFRYDNRTMKTVACSKPELCVYPHVVLCDGQKPSCDAGEICSPGVNNYNRPLENCEAP